MKASVILLVISLWVYKIQAQNLVPNPSFEKYNYCIGDVMPNGQGPDPFLDSSETVFETVKDWFISKPNFYRGPVFYVNSCTNVHSYYIPDTPWGLYQTPKTGNAVINSVLNDNPYRIGNHKLGLTTKLLAPMAKDSIYNISAWVSLVAWLWKKNEGDSGPEHQSLDLYAVSSFEAYCGVRNEYGIDSTTITTSLKSSTHPFLDDTLGWINITGLYKANGGEVYFTLRGNQDSAKILIRTGYRGFDFIYYFIDDVSITSVGYAPSNTLTDTIFCAGQSLTVTKRPYFDACIWSDGDTSTNRQLATTGKYWVTHTAGNISVTDTFNITVFNPISTLTDTTLCVGQPLQLVAGFAPHYLWNTHQTTPSITINQSGIYWVQKTASGCIGFDSFSVAFNPLPIITSLKDTTVCFDEVKQILLDAGKFKNYLWQPTGQITQTIFSTQAQVYLLSVTDSNNCSTKKQVAVMETCPDFVFIPNAFTPNGDGLNDVFLPKTRSLQSYQMSIINRWGEIVFTTQNPLQGWDGQNAPSDVYVVSIHYQVIGKLAQSVSKNITLLR